MAESVIQEITWTDPNAEGARESMRFLADFYGTLPGGAGTMTPADGDALVATWTDISAADAWWQAENIARPPPFLEFGDVPSTAECRSKLTNSRELGFTLAGTGRRVLYDARRRAWRVDFARQQHREAKVEFAGSIGEAGLLLAMMPASLRERCRITYSECLYEIWSVDDDDWPLEPLTTCCSMPTREEMLAWTGRNRGRVRRVFRDGSEHWLWVGDWTNEARRPRRGRRPEPEAAGHEFCDDRSHTDRFREDDIYEDEIYGNQIYDDKFLQLGLYDRGRYDVEFCEDDYYGDD